VAPRSGARSAPPPPSPFSRTRTTTTGRLGGGGGEGGGGIACHAARLSVSQCLSVSLCLSVALCPCVSVPQSLSLSLCRATTGGNHCQAMIAAPLRPAAGARARGPRRARRWRGRGASSRRRSASGSPWTSSHPSVLGIRAPRNCLWGPRNILYTISLHNVFIGIPWITFLGT
jgi:hypothetical protein